MAITNIRLGFVRCNSLPETLEEGKLYFNKADHQIHLKVGEEVIAYGGALTDATLVNSVLTITKADGTNVVLDFTDVASTYATKSALNTLDGKVTTNTNAISTLNGTGAGSVSKSISDAISSLNKTDTAVAGQVVSAVSETSGIITVSRRALVAADIPSLATSKITGLDTALAGKVPTTRTVNEKALSTDIILGGADIALTGYVKGSSSAAIAATDTVNAAIAKLEVRVDAAAASGVQSLTAADKSMTINPNSGAVTAKVALSATSDNELTLGADGLYVQPMQWGTF
jgi:hypothetical protein